MNEEMSKETWTKELEEIDYMLQALPNLTSEHVRYYITLAISKLPKGLQREIAKKVLFISVSGDDFAIYIPLNQLAELKKSGVIVLGEQNMKDREVSTILHEIAHYTLKHKMWVEMDEYTKQETDADKLVNNWLS